MGVARSITPQDIAAALKPLRLEEHPVDNPLIIYVGESTFEKWGNQLRSLGKVTEFAAVGTAPSFFAIEVGKHGGGPG